MIASDALPMAFSDAFLRRTYALEPESLIAIWFVVVGVWFLAMFTLTWLGWPATKAEQVSLWWLAWVTSRLAIFVTLPAAVLAIFVTFHIAHPQQFWIALVTVVWSIWKTAGYLQVRTFGSDTSERWPLMTDEHVLARVAELAAKMGIDVPTVRWLPSTGTQVAQAYAGTIQAPQICLQDGILHRLDEPERDAIIAHELGHIANRSLWLHALVLPVCCAVAVAVSVIFQWPVALAYALAMSVGLKRLVSRPLEINCDYRAGQVAGFRHQASALKKIHAIHSFEASEILQQLVCATASHPSVQTRLAALYAASPTEDRPDPPDDLYTVRVASLMSYGALFAWASVLTIALPVGVRNGSTDMLIVPLIVVALIPRGLVRLALQKQISLIRQQEGPSQSFFRRLLQGLKYVTPLTTVLAILAILYSFGSHDLVSALCGCVLLACAVWFIRVSQGDQEVEALYLDVHAAIEQREFNRAITLCVAHSKVVARSPLLRYCHAFCYALIGDRSKAIDELERLWIDKPTFPPTALALSELLHDTNQPERALQVVDCVAPLLPRDPSIPLSRGRILRRWGKLEEAKAACERALAIDPKKGTAEALAAALELDRGHLESARARIAKAMEMNPGHPYLLVIKAEIDLAGDDASQWQASVDLALKSIRSSPFIFMQFETTRLNELLTARQNALRQ